MHAALFLCCCPLLSPWLNPFFFITSSSPVLMSFSLVFLWPTAFNWGTYRSLGEGLFTGASTIYQWLHHGGMWPLAPLTANSSWGRGKPPQPMKESWWAQPCAALVQVATATVRSFSKGECFTPLLILGSYILLLLPCFLSLGGDGIDVPFMTEHCTVTSSPYFDHLWASAITVTHFKGKILWPKAENCPNLWA